MASTHEEVLARIENLYHLLFEHNGYGEMGVEIRYLRKHEKEVLIRCGKQYRYVVPCDCPASKRCACGAACGPVRKSATMQAEPESGPLGADGSGETGDI
jgi:hypothetical protein